MQLQAQDIQDRIRDYARKLAELSSPECQRQRKRCLQHLGTLQSSNHSDSANTLTMRIGKLKKQLSMIQSTSTSSCESEVSIVDASADSPLINDVAATKDPPSRAAAPRQRSHKAVKALLKIFHDELQELAKKKMLAAAWKKFIALKKKGIAVDVHGYGNMVNICVRCQDMVRARQLVEEMTQQSHIPMNIIITTTLLKGYSEGGGMKQAMQIWSAMTQPDSIDDSYLKIFSNIKPNTRAISTMFRGFKRVGEVDLGLKFYREYLLHEEINSETEVDLSTCMDYFALLVSQSLDSDALSAIGAHVGTSNLSRSASLQISFNLSAARCHALLGHTNETSLLLDRAQSSLSSQVLSIGSTSASTSLFLRHRHSEYQLIYEELKSFFESKISSLSTISLYDHLRRLLRALFKILYFGIDGSGDLISDDFSKDDDLNSIQSRLLLCLVQKFGINRIRMHGHENDHTTSDLQKRLNKERNQLAKAMMLKLFDNHSSRLDFSTLFQRETHSEESKPIFLEIGAGSGDWIVDQAFHRPSVDWIAMELRCDRVYNIFTKAFYRDTPNVAVLGGDASTIIPKYIPSNSIDKIFINFPEPPQHNSGIGDSQGQHLLTLSFMRQLWRVLKSPSEELMVPDLQSGTLTLLSDNFAYVQSIAVMLAEDANRFIKYKHFNNNRDESSSDNYKLLGAFQSVPNIDRGKVISFSAPIRLPSKILDSKKRKLGIALIENDLATDNHDRIVIQGYDASDMRIVVYCGNPGTDVGHSQQSSSYFDRLWENGNKNKRWYICLQKLF